LGIDHFKLREFEAAIQHHNKHLSVADAAGRYCWHFFEKKLNMMPTEAVISFSGKFIAHSNLGIVFQAMGTLAFISSI
jgi:hypothetical protein